MRAKGLVQYAQHNGKIAVVIALAHTETGRFSVRFIQDGVEVRPKLCNMEMLTGLYFIILLILRHSPHWSLFLDLLAFIDFFCRATMVITTPTLQRNA